MIQREIKLSEPTVCPVCGKPPHAYKCGWPNELTYIIECAPCGLRTEKHPTLALAQRKFRGIVSLEKRRQANG